MLVISLGGAIASPFLFARGQHLLRRTGHDDEVVRRESAESLSIATSDGLGDGKLPFHLPQTPLDLVGVSGFEGWSTG